MRLDNSVSTMGRVWFTVFVFLTIQQVFARECQILEKIMNCNECIQCGGIWCNTPDDSTRCSPSTDSFCPDGREQLVTIRNTPSGLDLMDQTGSTPAHQERGVEVDKIAYVNLLYPGSEAEQPNVRMELVNSTIQNFDKNNFYFEFTNTKYDKKYNGFKMTIEGMPTTKFCPATGRPQESVTFQVNPSNWKGHNASITYHVPCACACSSQVEVNSKQCDGHGNFSCGICTCEKGWKGDFCKEKDVPTVLPNQPDCANRGDIDGCMHESSNGIVCSNNGECTCDGKCKCDTSIEGSQYFDEFCTDICTTSGYCDSCLRNPKNGHCEDCYYKMFIEPYNKTTIANTNKQGKIIWINCEEKTDTCNIKYAAMRDDLGDTHIMIIDACAPVAEKFGAGVNVTMPVILGVVALLAAAAAVGGYVFWKNHIGDPKPFISEYGHIDPEDCVGQNPIYIDPTRSYPNPTYGRT